MKIPPAEGEAQPLSDHSCLHSSAKLEGLISQDVGTKEWVWPHDACLAIQPWS